jgi:hypothetical protein
MARTVEVLYDTTSGSGAALDTAAIPVAGFESLFGYYFANGGTPTACQAYIEDPKAPGTYLAIGAAATPGAVTSQLFCWGDIVTGGTGTITAPVPRSVRFTIGAIVAQTVRFILMGVKVSAGAN